jgi:hypothetical protein
MHCSGVLNRTPTVVVMHSAGLGCEEHRSRVLFSGIEYSAAVYGPRCAYARRAARQRGGKLSASEPPPS